MLRYGIPEYRLPKTALDSEIAAVKQLGARFRTNARWGTDFTLAELRKSHHAVFVAVGAQGAQLLRCAGDDLALSGLEFLDNVANGRSPGIGRNVIVVGGGNTAMDTCRTAVRLGAENVAVLYRRTRREMPCLMEEVDGAEAEGVHMQFLVAPTGLARLDNGRLRLTCLRMELGPPDASGRPRPVPVPGSEFVLEADTVIAAIGQSVDLALAAAEGLAVSSWGIIADPRTLATNLRGVFAGGDAVSGPDLAVRAVAAGRLAALSIDQYLTGRPVTGDPRMTTILMRAMSEEELATLFRRIERTSRVRADQIDIHRRRTGFDEIEPALAQNAAVAEARRCMTCGCRKADGCRVRRYATEYGADPYRFTGQRRSFAQDLTHPDIIYEPGKCILCDACVRIAAEASELLGLSVIGRGFNVTVGVPFDRPLSEALTRAAQRCAEACPTGALALRTRRSCDLAACDQCTCSAPPTVPITVHPDARPPA